MGSSENSARNRGGQSVYDRYTEATRKAIFYARQEAEHRGDTVITVADLLAGLSVDENTRADRVASLKSNAFYLRWLLNLPALPARVWETYDEFDRSHLELDTDAKRAFAFALMEADRDDEYWIDTDHLLRGLMRFPNKAHFAVLKTELNLGDVRIASRQDRLEFKPEAAPDQKLLPHLLRKYAAIWAPVLSVVCYLYILIQGFEMTLAPMAK
jgi:hypothetical protein